MLLIVQGGAGNRRPTKKALHTLAESLFAGYEILKNGGTALEAVVEAIVVLEDSGLFNAGLGAVLQLDGIRRLDASLMEGKTLRAGSVIGLEGIRHPVKAARLVMDTPHVMLTNLGARKIAKGLEPLPVPDEKSLKKLQEVKMKEKEMMKFYQQYFSTVGAVALDAHGDLAAGASTGGTYAMLPGRVGDTPIIGAGTYADNSSGAVSCTGKGEAIVRLSLAKEICMNLSVMPPSRAARRTLKRLLRTAGLAGVIVLDRKGRFAIMHSTNYMAAGYISKKRMVVQEGFTRVKEKVEKGHGKDKNHGRSG